METTIDHLAAIQRRMRKEGLPDLAIRSFSHYYRQLTEGQTGLIAETDIEPVDTLPDHETLDETYRVYGESQLPKAVMLKLNGGLGTSMGMQGAKSLLPVHDTLTFLDITARQAIHLGIPLVLMNSFSTEAESLEKLSAYPELDHDIPLDFLQHKAPKIEQETMAPVSWPDDPSLEWCPPGHGDIYTALATTGMLDKLLGHGIRYVFVSNSDNLGATLDLALLGYFSKENLPFMMEVADRTPADRKGGHLARKKTGEFLLRESAQCPPEDVNAFQNIKRHRYFNTNNLWIDLEVLKETLEAHDGILGLPMIRNAKTVDPRDPHSPRVYQLETAMGAAIEIFEGAGAIRVPRSRFAPVKTTNDLLAVQSDAYEIQDDYSVVLHPDRKGRPCVIHLDKHFYKTVDALNERFAFGPPSLRHCDTLTVRGDVRFGKDARCVGDVEIVNRSGQPASIESGRVLDGRVTFD